MDLHPKIIRFLSPLLYATFPLCFSNLCCWYWLGCDLPDDVLSVLKAVCLVCLDNAHQQVPSCKSTAPPPPKMHVIKSKGKGCCVGFQRVQPSSQRLDTKDNGTLLTQVSAVAITDSRRSCSNNIYKKNIHTHTTKERKLCQFPVR